MIGRTVHYVARGSADGKYQKTCRAAIVTAAEPADLLNPERRVDLTVLNPTGIFFSLSTPFDANGEEPGSWHWPEREDQP